MKHKFMQLRSRLDSLEVKVALRIATLILVCLTVLTIALFLFFRGQMMDEYNQMADVSLASVDRMFSYHMENARMLAKQWFTSLEGTKARLDEDYRMVENMNQVRNIQTVMANTPHLHAVYYLNSKGEITAEIGNGAPYVGNMDGMLQKQLSSRKPLEPFFWQTTNRYVNRSDVSWITLFFAELSIDSPGFTGAVVLNLDAERLSRNLFADNADERISFLLVDHQGRIVAQSSQNACGASVAEENWFKQMQDGTAQTLLREKDGERWDIRWLAAEESGFYIIAQTEVNSALTHADHLTGIVLLLMGITAMVTISLTLLTSRKTFEPFRALVENVRASTDIGARDEVQILSSYHDQLVENIRILRAEEEKNVIIKNLLLGNQGIQTELLKRGILSPDTGYRAVQIYLCEDERVPRSMQEYDLLRRSIGEQYAHVLQQLGPCTVLEIGLRRVLYLVKGHRVSGDEMYRVLEQAQRSAYETTGCRLITLLSEYADSGNVPCVALYQQLDARLKTRILLQEYEPLSVEAPMPRELPKLLQVFAVAVKKQDQDSYAVSLEALLTALVDQPYEECIANLAAAAQQVMHIRAKIDPAAEQNSLGYDAIVARLREIRSRDELLHWFDQLFAQASMQLQRVKEHTRGSQMEEAVDYIRAHYDDYGMNVNTLADHLNLSPSYFGKIFREFTGLSTLEFITKTRMERAHDLLLTEPGKDIGSIATEVGYSNNAYFATAFKKYYGVSPSKYRDYHMSNM